MLIYSHLAKSKTYLRYETDHDGTILENIKLCINAIYGMPPTGKWKMERRTG